MIPKILTALISAAILSALLGALPCEATGMKKAGTLAGTASLIGPATGVSRIMPTIEDPGVGRKEPEADESRFVDGGIR